MPTAKYFDKCPEFPSDVPVANVPLLSYQLLQQNDPGTSSQLFQALREYGFFILDLNTCDDGRALLQDAEAMFDLTNETFDLGKQILNNYPVQFPRSLDGYKETGVNATDDGYKDAVETFMVSQDDILGITYPPVPRPSTVEARKQNCQNFCNRSHKVTSVILNNIDASLGLSTGTLASLCSVNKPSATGARMIRTCPSALSAKQHVNVGAHTDIGVLTLVFNVVGGLQIRPAESSNDDEKWKFIRPRKGCVVINAGDTLVEWTGGVLRSNLHRVHIPPGDQANVVRQSLAYLLRPSRDGSMRRLQGSSIIPPLAAGEEDEKRSPDEWASWRVQQLNDGHYQPRTIGGVHATPQIKV